MAERRIAVAGCQHETNTFAPMRAPFSEFVKADAWPGLTRGQDLFDVMAGKNLPLAGFIDSAQNHGHTVLPVLWCSAEPSSYVAEDAFERIADMICGGLSQLGALDAVYLDIHGAMVTEHHQDGEGELLHRVRSVIGSKVPLIASLDLHANVTARMVDVADGFTIFRTYPHIDMAATGSRAYDLLARTGGDAPVHKAYRKLPFLVPLSAQCTDFEPNASIYARLPALQVDGVWSVDFAAGFPPADILECGPALVAYGSDKEAVEHAADRLYRFTMDCEPRFDNRLLSPDQAVAQAVTLSADGPVVLADVQDNPGAGGSSDTTDLLAALVRNGARGAVMAIVNDPEAAQAAHAAGVGSMVEIKLGGKFGQDPYADNFEVKALGDGRFLCTGTMYGGLETDIGPMALLRVYNDDCDVQVIVGSERMQCLDLAIFRHLGVEPRQHKILAVKSTVHFRADFDPIATATLLVEAPGANPCRLINLDYKNLREGVRLEPMGPAFKKP